MHKCFISYKKEDKAYRTYLINEFGSENFINKSLDKTIDSEDGDYVMKVIREEYLNDSTVTIFLIGTHSSEKEGYDYMGDKNYFIKRELSSSLYNGNGNTRSGILGVVLPDMYDKVYAGSGTCKTCGNEHNYVNINDSSVIREFSYNYYIKPHNGCAWSEEERYCVLVKWDDFIKDPEQYINQAYDKRFSEISKKVHVKGFDRG